MITASPRLVAGGEGEAFEAEVQRRFKQNCRHIIADLTNVATIDSAGIRALVRGHTTAQRLRGTFRLVGATPQVRDVLHLAHLDNVFEMYPSIARARAEPWSWRLVALAGAAVALSAALVWTGHYWPDQLATRSIPNQLSVQDESSPALASALQPFRELVKLIVAAAIGLLVTAVHKPSQPDRPLNKSLLHAQVLLCVSGAMMMIIIGNSLARAFGIAGAASIVRFRTPVDDPKDVTILFLLMGLGMACGLGAFGVAGLGMLFLSVFLLLLDRGEVQTPRALMLELVGSETFSSAYVHNVFARHGVVFELREVAQGADVMVKYYTRLPPETSLEDLSTELMGSGSSVKSVAWDVPKRSE